MKAGGLRKRAVWLTLAVAAVILGVSAYFMWWRVPPADKREAPVRLAVADTKPDGAKAPSEDRTGFVQELRARTSSLEDRLQIDMTAAELKESVPVHPRQLARVEAVANETVPELILNAHHLDDWALASISVGDAPDCVVLGAFANRVVTRLARVQRLLEIGRTDPSSVVPAVTEVFEAAIESWPNDFAEFMKRRKDGKSVSYGPEEELAAVDDEGRILAGTYVLAELGYHDALPSMLKMASWYRVSGQDSQDDFIEGRVTRTPIAPGTVLYAMHRLIGSHAQTGLSAAASAARTAYMGKAAQILPEPTQSVTTAWHSEYDRHDPRIQVLTGPFPAAEGLFVEGQPKTGVVEWPWKSRDGKNLSQMDGRLSAESKELLLLAEQFIREAYPERTKAIPPLSAAFALDSRPSL